MSEYYKEWYLKNKEKHKDNVKKYQAGHKEDIKKNVYEWRKKNPEKLREAGLKWYYKDKQKSFARRKAWHEIKIPENQICQICKGKMATQRHHADYSNPKQVLFVCAKCNKNEKLL